MLSAAAAKTIREQINLDDDVVQNQSAMSEVLKTLPPPGDHISVSDGVQLSQTGEESIRQKTASQIWSGVPRRFANDQR